MYRAFTVVSQATRPGCYKKPQPTLSAAKSSGRNGLKKLPNFFVNLGGPGDGLSDFLAQQFAKAPAQTVQRDPHGPFAQAQSPGPLGVTTRRRFLGQASSALL